jgi:hypothetical protein
VYAVLKILAEQEAKWAGDSNAEKAAGQKQTRSIKS